MDSFYIAFNAVMPITCLVVLGYYLKEKKYLSKQSISELNKLNFMLFLPVLTFNNLIKTNIREIFDIKLLGYTGISIILTVIILSIVVPVFEEDTKKQGALIQGIYRSNFIILGVPITTYIAGSQSVSIASILIMVVIPLYNMLAVIVLSTHSGKETDFKILIKGIVKNPLIIASLAGIIFAMIQIKLPVFIDKTIADIAKLGSILPMMLLGSLLNFSTVVSNIRNIIIAVMGRLIIVPLIFLSLAIYLGFDTEKIVALIAVYCAPTAVSSSLMAEQMGCDGELAAQIVIFTTVVSCFTIFLWVFVLSFFNFI